MDVGSLNHDHGGEYVEILNVCMGHGGRGESSFKPQRSRLPSLNEMEELEKENTLERGRGIRTSLYGRKAEVRQFNPKKPLSNPYRTSEHDQMPIKVLPLTPLDPHKVPRFYKTSRTSICCGTSHEETAATMSPKLRSASVDNLLITAETKGYVTRSSSQRSDRSEPEKNGVPMSTYHTRRQEYSQTWCRNKSVKRRKPAQNTKLGFNFFTRSSKRKSRSEYKLNKTVNILDETKTEKPSLSHGRSENFLDHCNNNVTSCVETEGKREGHTGKLHGLRTRLQRRLHLGRKEKPARPDSTVIENRQMLEVDNDSLKRRQSPRKRKSSELCDLMCEPTDNNNETYNLLAVLNNKELCGDFRKFLSNEHSDENLDFWMMCERFKTSEDKVTVAEAIFKQFLDDGAPREVNIDAKTRSTLQRNTKILNKTFFIPAQECIYRLMDEDSFRRFCSIRRSKRSRLR